MTRATGAPRAALVAQTRASFEYQWSKLSSGTWALADADHRGQLPTFISALAGLEPGWFAGRTVLDAGCGPGRHAFGLCALGAQVTVLDLSASVVRQARESCSGFANFKGGLVADLLHPLPFRRTFDLVWSYGVLHHTGNTHVAFRNIARHVAAGGHLLVMVYGEPRPDSLEDYRRFAWLEAWRLRCRDLSFDRKAEAMRSIARDGDVLGYFDAISPGINDRHHYDELAAWFHEEGFVDVRRRLDEMDNFVVGRRPA